MGSGVSSHTLTLTLFFCLSFFPTLLTTRASSLSLFFPFVFPLSLSPCLHPIQLLYRGVGGWGKVVPEVQRQREKMMMEEWFKLQISKDSEVPKKPHKSGRLCCKSLEAITNKSADDNGDFFFFFFFDRYVLKVEESRILKRQGAAAGQTCTFALTSKHTNANVYLHLADTHTHSHRQPGIQGNLVAWNKSRARASH